MYDRQEGSLPSGLQAHTGYWLNRLRGLVHSRFEAALAAEEVTVAQWSVLITVYRGDAVAPLEIARFIDVDPGAMTRLLDRLEDKGLIQRGPVDGDRRRMEIVLTARAREMTPRLSALADGNDAAFFGALSEGEQSEFRRLLAKLLRAQGTEVPVRWEKGS